MSYALKKRQQEKEQMVLNWYNTMWILSASPPEALLRKAVNEATTS